MASVRTRTTAATLAVVAVALGVGGWLLLVTLERSLVHSDDHLARARVADLAAQLGRGQTTFRLDDLGEDGVAQIVAPDGRVLASSPGLAGRPAVVEAPPHATGTWLRVLRGIPDDDETETYRVWLRTVETPDGPALVFVGSSLESVSEAVSTVRRSLLVGLPLLWVAAGVGTRIVVGRALRPVERLRGEVAAIAPEVSGRRLTVPGAGDEIAALAATMNRMLARVDDAQQRQREFVADASHELQTPLTALRTQLEVALADPDAAQWPELARLLLADSARVDSMLGNLLFLASQDAGSGGETREHDLDQLLAEGVARCVPPRGIAIDTSGVSPTPVWGDGEALRRVIDNLLQNAVRHAASRVWVATYESGEGAALDVSDDGPGVPPADRDRVFERFVRLDRAGSPARPGAGLGLAICRAIVARHGGAISLRDRTDGTGSGPGPGVTVAVRLPQGPGPGA